MLGVFIGGVVTGVVISFGGALFGVGFYIALREGIKQQVEKEEKGLGKCS